MIKITRWKIIVVALATVFGILFTLPNLLTADQRAKLPGFLPHQVLNQGLDLQGGSYLLLEVDTSSLQKQRLNDLVEDVTSTLNKAGIAASQPAIVDRTLQVQINDPGQNADALKALNEVARRNAGAPGGLLVSRDGQTLKITAPESAARAEAVRAVDQSIEIVRRRIDKLGTKEPSIIKQGANRIAIQAPGESDPEKLKSYIGQTAKLTFQMVDDADSPANDASRVPFGSELLPYAEGAASGGQSNILVKKRALVTGDNLRMARSDFDSRTNLPAIAFGFDGDGAKKFGEATRRNVNKRFAIVLDGKVISAPVIQGPILGGTGQITGNFTPESAKELADLLEGGALPAPLNVISQSKVGAGLGADAVAAGAKSLLIGAVAIIVFMVLAYGLFGLFATAALVVNVLMLIGTMSMMQFTMTLPGIAGIILTLAVAVDANVLIYERMRDEARTGHGAMAAADHGFRRALVSIIDANVTSLISAFIMFSAGSGPVKGFALTLMIGVFTSVFSSVLVTQLLIGWWFKLAKPKTLPI